MLETEALKEVNNSVVKRFVDVIILGELKKDGPLSGYDIISLILQKFHVLISPGKVYSVLYALKRKGLIKGDSSVKKRIYTLTSKGERAVMGVIEESQSILRYLLNLF